MPCSRCGREVEPSSHFCPSCGNPVKVSPSRPSLFGRLLHCIAWIAGGAAPLLGLGFFFCLYGCLSRPSQEQVTEKMLSLYRSVGARACEVIWNGYDGKVNASGPLCPSCLPEGDAYRVAGLLELSAAKGGGSPVRVKLEYRGTVSYSLSGWDISIEPDEESWRNVLAEANALAGAPMTSPASPGGVEKAGEAEEEEEDEARDGAGDSDESADSGRGLVYQMARQVSRIPGVSGPKFESDGVTPRSFLGVELGRKISDFTVNPDVSVELYRSERCRGTTCLVLPRRFRMFPECKPGNSLRGCWTSGRVFGFTVCSEQFPRDMSPDARLKEFRDTGAVIARKFPVVEEMKLVNDYEYVMKFRAGKVEVVLSMPKKDDWGMTINTTHLGLAEKSREEYDRSVRARGDGSDAL